MDVKVKDIDIAAYQIRDGLNEEAVARYAERLEATASGVWPFPAVVLNLVSGSRYVCIDGAHRIAAAIRAGRETVQAEVETKPEDEARMDAAIANLANGLPLTSTERKKAIHRVLTLRPAWGDTQVAQWMGLHRNTVARVRKELGLGSKTERTAEAVATQADVAKTLGISQGTVSNIKNAQYGAFLIRTTQGIQPPTPPMPKRPVATPEPTPVADIEAEQAAREAKREALLAAYRDEIGQDIPVGRKAEYDAERQAVGEWVGAIAKLKHAIKAAGDDGFLRAFSAPGRRMDDILADLDALRAAIQDRRPECLCRCNGEGCKACEGRGFLTREQYRLRIPEEEQFRQD